MDGSDTLAGRVVADRYRLGERIGVGGMAEVRRADDLRLDRPVAVKFLDPHLAAQPDLRRRFEDEARAAARLSHHAVVQVFDSGEWEDRPYLVMELLSGRTFADEMAGGPLPVERVRRVAEDVLSALEAAHAAGVLHRDVKPANLLIGPGGTIKIADFGIAKADPIQGERSAGETVAAAPPTMTGQMLGTPSYLAPERVAGHPATPATDLWALGVVCWEALAGRRAFPGTGIQTAMAVASTDLAAVSEIRPDADPALARAVDVAVRRDPAARWLSAADMRAALLDDPVRAAGAGGPRVGGAGPLAGVGLAGAALGLAGAGAGADLAASSPARAGTGPRADLAATSPVGASPGATSAAGAAAGATSAAGAAAGATAAAGASMAGASMAGASAGATSVPGGSAAGAPASASSAGTEVAGAGFVGSDATVAVAPPVAAVGPATVMRAAPEGATPGGAFIPTTIGRSGFDNRAGTFGLVAIGVIAAIIALAALAGGHKKAVSTKPLHFAPVVATTSTSTSTSTTTSTTAAPVAPPAPRRSGGKHGGGDGG